MRRRKNKPPVWLWAGLAPLLGGILWWFRRRAARSEPTPVEALQVPVTGPKGAKSRPGDVRSGPVQVYSSPEPSVSAEAREKRPFPWLAALLPLAVLAAVVIFLLLGRQTARPQVTAVPGGRPEAGQQALQAWGCGSCHTIPGVAGAVGKVGPELNQMAEQTYIAGMLPNTPDNLIHWIMNPQEVLPGNAMPDTGVSETMARDMAAYLYSIR